MSTDIFSNVRFYVIDCKDEKLVDELKAHGAQRHPILSDTIKFAISDDGDAGEVGEAEDLYAVPVITSEWIRLSLIAKAFLPFTPFHPNYPKIFSGVTAVISDLSVKDSVTLAAHMIIRGATIKNALDSTVTHLITSRASGFMYERCKAQLSVVKTVSPDWVIDSVKSKECLDCAKYVVDLLVKPAPPKPPIMPKPIVTNSAAIEPQPQHKQLTTTLPVQQLGTTVEFFHLPAEAVRQISGFQTTSTGNLASRIITSTAGLISLAPGGVQMVPHVQQQTSSGFHHQIQHQQEPRPTKGSGKGKANKHPSEQGLNEEQKHAIVMQNVKNILSQQPNWNKDNAQNRGDGGGGQLPGTFLPSGSAPVPTGGAQRKPKSPKSPGNRGANNQGASGGLMGPGGIKGVSGGATKPSKIGATMKKPDLAEIAAAPSIIATGIPTQQQQQFTALTLDASGAATQIFPHSGGTAAVLVTTTNPGVRPRGPVANPQTANPTFLLQQQQQQQHAFLAAQSQFQKGRGGPATQQVQMSPVVLQGAQPAQGQSRTATFIVRAPSASDLQTEGVQVLMEGSKDGQMTANTTTNQVLLQPSTPQQQQHLIQMQQQKRVPSPSAGVLSPVFIQGKQPQPATQFKQSPMQPVQIAGMSTQPTQQPPIRPQPPQQRPPQPGNIRQPVPGGQQPQPPSQQQQYAQLAQQMRGQQQQIIIQTSAGVQQVVTAQDFGNAQYISASGATQMRAVAATPAQCASPRTQTIIGSPPYTQQQQVITTNGMGGATSIVYHSTAGGGVTAAGVPQDTVSVTAPQQERVAYITSVQQQHQGQVVAARQDGNTAMLLAMKQQQIPLGQQQQVPMSIPSGPRPGTMQPQQQPQQLTTTIQGQFYNKQQGAAQPNPQRILVQSQHSHVQQPHTLMSQAPQFQQQQLPSGSYMTQAQTQMIPRGSSAVYSPQQLGVPPGGQTGVRPLHPHQLANSTNPSQIRQMMTTVQQQPPQRHMVPSQTPQYRGMAPQRSPVASYATTIIRPTAHPQQQQQYLQQQQITQLQQQHLQVATQPQMTPQQPPTAVAPPVFQLPSFYGHVGVRLPTAAQDCFIGCVMLLMGYDSFGEEQKAVWRKIMRYYGAEVVLTYDPARVTHVIVDWMLDEAEVVKQALKDRKRVVTIYWVNDIIGKGRMIPPYEINHLPSPFCTEITFSFIRNQVISMTGFEGIERQKVEVLIKQLGATYTDYLDQANTLLVCKRPEGRKYEMASVWGIPCVNVRWLQDIYLGDVNAMSAEISHKYLCFDVNDVSIGLEYSTPRVQEIMIGWREGICISQESWVRIEELRRSLKQEEIEEEAAAAQKLLQQSNEEKNKEGGESKSVLRQLTLEETERALRCQLREDVLREEAERVAKHRAEKMAAAAAAAATATSVISQVAPLPPAIQPVNNSQMFHNTSVTTTTTTYQQMHQQNQQQPPVVPPSCVADATPMAVLNQTTLPASPAASTQTQQQPAQTFKSETESSQQATPSSNLFKRPHSPVNPASSVTIDDPQPPPSKRTDACSGGPKSVPPPCFAETLDNPPRPASSNTLPCPPPLLPSPPAKLDEPLPPKPESPNQSHPTLILPEASPSAAIPSRTIPPIDTEVRIVYTGMDIEARLACAQLIAQMPPAVVSVAPYRFVDSVQEATHVIAERLVRTSKIYMAVALGRALVTPKWLQACVLRGNWLAATEWLLQDKEAEENLGINLATALSISHTRNLLGEPGLFSDLEFWFSPKAYHREECEKLVRACGGRIRERRPTQKMALLSTPKQVIVCHEEEANVASYLMRTKNGNRAVHHEEFILSGVLRQQLDFDSYQIQYVSSQLAELHAAISLATGCVAASGLPPPPAPPLPPPSTAITPMAHQSPSHPQAHMRPPPPPPPHFQQPPYRPTPTQQQQQQQILAQPTTPQPHQQQQTTAPPCVLLVSGAENRQSPLMYYISSGSTITSAPAPSVVAVAANNNSNNAFVSGNNPEGPLTLQLPEGVSAVVVATGETNTVVAPATTTPVVEGMARVAAADAHAVASVTAALTTSGGLQQQQPQAMANQTLIMESHGVPQTRGMMMPQNQVIQQTTQPHLPGQM